MRMKIRILHWLLPAVALFALTSCEYGRMWETPAVRPHEEPMIVVEEGSIPFSGGEAIYKAMSAEEIESPVSLNDPTVIAEGTYLYSLYCVHCHGRNHDGFGTVGQSFVPQPQDIRSEKVQTTAPGAMFKEISYGIPGGRQPPLATTIEVMERWKIVAFVKSLENR